MEKISSHKIVKNPWILFVLVAFFGSYFSEGFWHPDEHYQIFGPMSYKLGMISFDQLPWEFQLSMRSFLIPGILYLLALPMSVVGISPFMMAFIIRFVFSSVFILSLRTFVNSLTSDDIKRRDIAFFLLGTWFIPFLMVRTSPEVFSTSLFFVLLSLPSLCRKSLKMEALLIGILSVLIFNIRFQMILMIAPLVLFFIYRKDKKIPFLIMLILGATLGEVVALLCDFWGHQKWVLSPFQYFYQNFFASKANQFGVSPWWFYFTQGILKSLIIPGCLFLYTFRYLAKESKFLIYLFLIGIFVLGHMFIPHKELRFIVPSVLMLAVFTGFYFDSSWRFRKIYFAFNIIPMIFILLTPASKDIGLYKEMSRIKDVKKIYQLAQFNEAYKLELPFYNQNKIEVISTDKFIENSIFLSTGISQLNFFKTEKKCENFFSSYPQWILNFPVHWTKRWSILGLWRC